MEHYQIDIANGKIDEIVEIEGVDTEHRRFNGDDGITKIYYTGGKGNVKSIICEAFNERGAAYAVEKFLAFMYGKTIPIVP